MNGKLYGVGVGPGDSRLLTLRAVDILKESDVIFCPVAQKEKESIALNIAREHISEKTRIIELSFPMSRDKNALDAAWHASALLIKAELDEGRSCAFITLGDPSLYSTYVYLQDKLQKMLPGLIVETVPGIISPTAAAAAAGIPLAKYDEKFAIIPYSNLGSSLELDVVFDNFQSVVLMKIGNKLGELIEYLESKGLLDNAVLATRVEMAGQSVEKLSSETELNKGYLSVCIVRK